MAKLVRVSLLFCAFALAVLAGCGGGNTVTVASPPSAPLTGLTAAEVSTVVQNAAIAVDAPVSIAVTDRNGRILAVFNKTGAPASSTGNFGASVGTADLAVALARTAAYFSNDQAPLSSR